MFAKVSLNSFIYDIIDILVFPNATTVAIYSKNNIIKCFAELILIMITIVVNLKGMRKDTPGMTI